MDGEPTRLRRLFGTRFVVLTQGERAGSLPTDVPHQVHALEGIDGGGVLRTALRAGPDTVHVVRPDGHLAAVLPSCDPAAVVAALHRARGRS